MVRRVSVPVVPAVIEGAYQAWPASRRLFRGFPVRVQYGPPLDVRGLKGEQITALIDRTFHELRDQLRKRIEAEGG